MLKNIINFDEEVEAKIELTEIKLSKDEIFQIIINELAYLKKQNTTKNNNEELEKKFNEYKNIILEKDKKILELKKITENEEKTRPGSKEGSLYYSIKNHHLNYLLIFLKNCYLFQNLNR